MRTRMSANVPVGLILFMLAPTGCESPSGPKGLTDRRAGRGSGRRGAGSRLDPDAGRVLVDGRDVRDIALAELRARVAVVEQDAFVFNTSILENVQCARSNQPRALPSQSGSLPPHLRRK